MRIEAIRRRSIEALMWIRGLSGFWWFLTAVVLVVLASAFSPVRSSVLAVLTSPLVLLGLVLPGQTPHAEFVLVADAVGWGLWLLAPLGLAPLLLALASPLHSALPLAPAARLLGPPARLVDRWLAGLGGAARWCAMALVVVVATVVVQRYVFGIAFAKLQESILYLHAGLFMLMAAHTLRQDGHVRVDVFYDRFGPRTRAWVNILGVYLFLVPMCVIILRGSDGYVEAAWRVLERSTDSTGLPLVFALKTLIPIFALTLLAQGFAIAAHGARTILGVADPQEAERAGAPGGHAEGV